jgi:flagellar basal-body rod protein FlgB
MAFDLIGSATTAALRVGLDAATLRHQAIALNIANANTENYAPVGVNFETQLANARRSLNEYGVVSSNELDQIIPFIEPISGFDGKMGKVRLDTEIANLAQNSVQYQALLRGLNSHFGLLISAASDGRK